MTSPTYIIAAAALLAAAAPAKAQVIDLSLITCKQLLTTEPDRQAFIAWWMSGYFSASKNLNVVDVRYVERNGRVIGKYCKSHQSDTVMNAMQKNWR